MKKIDYKIKPKYLKTLLLIWALLIMTLSSLPADKLPILDGINIDKLLHLTVYFVLGRLMFLNQRNGTLGSFSKHQLLLAAVLFASLDEAQQAFIPNRSVSVYDLSANTAGLIISYFISKITGKRR